MDGHKVSEHTVFLAALLIVGFSLFSVLPGCKGDTGPAGVAAAPASFETADCNSCHHLNNLPLTSASPIFTDGLGGEDKTVTTGGTTTLAPNLGKLPQGETAIAFSWTLVGGLTATLASASTQTVTVFMPAAPDYKSELISNLKMPDRTMIVPVTFFALEEAENAIIQVTVFTDAGKSYYDQVLLADEAAEAALAPFASVNTGLPTVPVNVPVLLQGKGAGGQAWSLTPAAGSSAALSDSGTRYPFFTPDAAGQYVVSESASGATITLYAGTWRGEISGTDDSENPIPDTACTACHNDTIATDNFTPWKTSGHAHIFSKNLENGGHYGPDCFPCHTVGFALAAVNNGFDDQTDYSTFISDASMFSSSSDTSRYQRMWSTYPQLAKLTNVQCEHCHGPQVESAGGGFIASHGTSTTSPGLEGPRTSLAADVCGSCHGEPLRHGRFQQWQESGHANFDLAIERGVGYTSETSGIPTGFVNRTCGGCHSAQGFMVYLNQLRNGLASRTIPTIPLTPDTVQPQTCATCHDPHAEGTKSGSDNAATVRVTGDTPMLPGGFAATGVGRGAMCIVCHNSRNGEKSSGAGNPGLHQDGDPQWNTLTSYSAPHEACQGDVLMGKNAYFVGNGDMRSPHSNITDTCTTCHMELTPPPPLLSYNLSGTNHTFLASPEICVQCHGINQAIASNLQEAVTAELDLLRSAIEDQIISHYTNTIALPIDQIVDLGARGAINIISKGTATTLSLNSAPGVRISDLGSDTLAKALWNFYLMDTDGSFGIHNPDFAFLVISESRFQVNSIPEPDID